MKKQDIKKVLLSCNDLYKEYNIAKIGLFGSYNSKKNNNTSDIDLIVEFSKTINLFKFAHLIKELQQLLNSKVDLVTPNALKPYIKKQILKEVDWIA